jgi:hypothetical protein
LLLERERERITASYSHAREKKETGVSIVGLNVVFSFSKSLGLKLQFPLSAVRYGERNMQRAE